MKPCRHGQNAEQNELIEPVESELTNQVEYDMDEQDQEWLDLVNDDRRKAQVGTVSPEVFEIMMDRLEKEWFELVRVPVAEFLRNMKLRNHFYACR